MKILTLFMIFLDVRVLLEGLVVFKVLIVSEANGVAPNALFDAV